MKLYLTLEHRFKKDSQGIVYATSNSVNTALWERYLEVFDHITIVSRVEHGASNVNSQYVVSHPKVSFFEIPYYVGAAQFLLKRGEIRKRLHELGANDGVFIVRAPSAVGKILIKQLNKRKKSFGVEVVGDPYELFAPGATNVSFAAFHRIRGTWSLKQIVKQAAAVLYVTKFQLQQRYPANKNAFTTYASNVNITNDFCAQTAKTHQTDLVEKTVKLCAIGSLEQLYKSPDVVVKAISVLKSRGITATLTWLGEGKFKTQMQELSVQLAVNEQVRFMGNVSRAVVSEQLASSDIFIHVSRTEGLPRAIVEAMAKGLPVIGSRVGGIPELLSEQALLEKIDANTLADKIYTFITNGSLYNSEANRNFAAAKEYLNEKLQEQRKGFYKTLINLQSR